MKLVTTSLVSAVPFKSVTLWEDDEGPGTEKVLLDQVGFCPLANPVVLGDADQVLSPGVTSIIVRL